MAKHHVDILEAELEGTKWLQVTAVRNKVVIGTATVFWLDLDYKAPELCNLFVQESARRQGVAQAMIQAVRKYHPRPTCLNVLRESDAYWLYRKMGFLEVGPVKDKENFMWMMDYGH